MAAGESSQHSRPRRYALLCCAVPCRAIACCPAAHRDMLCYSDCQILWCQNLWVSPELKDADSMHPQPACVTIQCEPHTQLCCLIQSGGTVMTACNALDCIRFFAKSLQLTLCAAVINAAPHNSLAFVGETQPNTLWGAKDQHMSPTHLLYLLKDVFGSSFTCFTIPCLYAECLIMFWFTALPPNDSRCKCCLTKSSWHAYTRPTLW